MGVCLQLLNDSDPASPPQQQAMSRKLSLEQEHKHALERAVTLNIPHAVASTGEESSEATGSGRESHQGIGLRSSGKAKWDGLVASLFARNESGGLALKKELKAESS